MKENAWQSIIVLTTIIAIVVLEIVALQHGINGTLLKSVLAIIGGIGGAVITKAWYKRKGR